MNRLRILFRNEKVNIKGKKEFESGYFWKLDGWEGCGVG